MPNVRLRMGQPTPTTVVMQTALNIDGISRNSVGAVLPGCVVHLFRTDNDLFRGRTISDLSGRYSLSPYDTTAHYVHAVKPGTADTTLLTADCTYHTADTSGEVSGATINGLFGV